MHNLTDVQIKKAKTEARPYKLFDGGGLHLLVQPEGSKLWRWKYSYRGKAKTMALGRYPEVTLKEARDRHLDARRRLDAGIDPMEERKAAKREAARADLSSFEAVARAFHSWWKTDKNPRYAEAQLWRIEQDLLPTLGHRAIAEIEPLEVVEVVKAVESRSAKDLAKRYLQLTNQIFRYAKAHGYAKVNPVGDLKPSDILRPQAKTHRARVDEAELPTLLRKIENYQGRPETRLALRLMALTFVRTSELIEARWNEFNFETRMWTIPAERMKQVKGATPQKPHFVPLARQTIDALESLYEITGSADGFCFPHQWSKTQTMSHNTMLEALYAMGYKGAMTGHGFRGVASTILHERRSEHGFTSEHIDLQLAHIKRNAVSAAYDNSKSLKERTEMMQWWADYLDKARRSASGLTLVA